MPGNPVSAMVCGMVLFVPMVRAMLGLGQQPALRASPHGQDAALHAPGAGARPRVIPP